MGWVQKCLQALFEGGSYFAKLEVFFRRCMVGELSRFSSFFVIDFLLRSGVISQKCLPRINDTRLSRS